MEGSSPVYYWGCVTLPEGNGDATGEFITVLGRDELLFWSWNSLGMHGCRAGNNNIRNCGRTQGTFSENNYSPVKGTTH